MLESRYKEQDTLYGCYCTYNFSLNYRKCFVCKIIPISPKNQFSEYQGNKIIFIIIFK